MQQPLQALFAGVPYLGALVSGPPVGIGILSAGIILAIMIIPFIASVMRDVFDVTPPMLKESAYALGSTTWEVVSQGGAALHQGRRHRRHHAGPGPRARRDHGGHLRDRQLQPARFAVAVRSRPTASPRRWPTSSPKPASGLHQAALIYLGLVLFFITFVVLSLSKLLLARLRKSEGAKS